MTSKPCGKNLTRKQLAILAICLFMVSIPPPPAHAQESEKFIDRFSLRTNTLDWLATVPNIQVGFDLFPGAYNRSSILLGVKWNWNTYHKLPPYYVFDVFDVRAEYRMHFRFKPLSNAGGKHSFFSLERKNPHSWIAHYIGGYADYSSYSIKPGANGRQGFQGGIGVSTGIEMPLYQYKGGAIDLDLGVSAGLLYTRYQQFVLSQSHSQYLFQQDGQKVLPMITELRAVFSWRRHSVKEKYLEDDPELPVYRETLGNIRTAFASATKETFDGLSRPKSETKAMAESDSLYRAKFVEWIQNDQVSYEKDRLQYQDVTPQHKKALEKEIDRLGKKAIDNFDAALRKKEAAARKEAEKAQREAEKARKEAEKAEKEIKEKESE